MPLLGCLHQLQKHGAENSQESSGTTLLWMFSVDGQTTKNGCENQCLLILIAKHVNRGLKKYNVDITQG